MVTQRAVGALAIIERFDVVEDLSSCLGAGVKAAAINQLQLEGLCKGLEFQPASLLLNNRMLTCAPMTRVA